MIHSCAVVVSRAFLSRATAGAGRTSPAVGTYSSCDYFYFYGVLYEIYLCQTPRVFATWPYVYA